MEPIQYILGDKVWHTDFNSLVTFLGISPPGNKWYAIRLSNGGYMDTQKVEKYTDQDKIQ